MKLFKFYKSSMLLVALFGMTGCAAPLIIPVLALQGAALGFATFKTVQTTTGGSVDIGFADDEQSIKDHKRLSEISNPAIWPGNEAEVYLAESMENSGAFESVITPSRISKALRKLDLDDKMNGMTRKEILNSFRSLCRETQADSIVAFKSMGTEAHTNMWSFDRANQIKRDKMIIYSYKSKTIVYEGEIELRTDFGGNMQNDHEVLKIAADAAVEKIIELKRS